MISGIGLDIVEISRIRKMAERQSKFARRILTETEWNEYEQLSGKRQYEYLAGRFSAKEAFSKAMGTGIGKDLSFQDIEVAKDENGKPFFSFPKSIRSHLSITHTEEYAAAQVILEKD
jgi:holo-[acyl-carrier protein] synthase